MSLDDPHVAGLGVSAPTPPVRGFVLNNSHRFSFVPRTPAPGRQAVKRGKRPRLIDGAIIVL